MIKIKIHDTLIDIVEKIEACDEWDVILDFPIWHSVLHNYISLKVLKSKAKNKKLIITTNDRVSKKVGKSLWIEYSMIKNSAFLKNEKNANLMQHNFTFWEYFKFQFKNYIHEFKSSIDTNKKLNAIWKYGKYYSEKTTLHIFIGALAWSMILFAFIYYFAVSKSYIYITPETIIKKEAYNFVFKENIENNILWNNKNIKINTLYQKINSSEIYASTEIQKNDSELSSWKVSLYNIYESEQKLIAQTRLQSPDGNIFAITEWVTIPGSIKDNFWNVSPWKIEVNAVARVKDITWSYSWTKANISSDIRMILPGLPINEQTKIYAISSTDFTGWEDTFTRTVSDDDINNAKELFIQKLKSDALKSIKNEIFNKNNINSTQLDILSWWKSIIYSEPEILIEPWVRAWTVQNNFELSWSISVQAYLYNKESVLQKLKTLVNEKKLEWVEKISHIDENSLRMSQIIYIKEADDENDFELKATFEIEALFLYDFLHNKNTYIEQLKSEIRWSPIDDAQKILLNDPHISQVEIEVRPFFIQTISNIYNNIIFKVL